VGVILGNIMGNGTAVTGLGGARGYGEVMLPRGDDAVAQVDVSAVFGAGFKLGGAQFAGNQLYISTDGLISFGAGFAGVAAQASAIPVPFLAIFNADVDTRLDGEGAESGGIWLDIDTAADCVTITWDQVGFYRRNATLTDTFQMQIFDRGNGAFDVVYRYQNISWTSGDLQGGWGGLGGTAALIGSGAGGATQLLPGSGDAAAQLALSDTTGNTGIRGLWLLQFGAASVITGTGRADTLQGTGASDTVQGLGGADVLLFSAAADLLDGGAGQDIADYRLAPAFVVIDLQGSAANRGLASGDRLVAIEGVHGSAFADTLLGDLMDNGFDGDAGADVLDGRLGADDLFGGSGDDRLFGGDGDDRLEGGLDHDRILGGAGNDSLLGGDANDRLFGSTGADALSGGNGADWVYGGDGADTLTGGGTAADMGDNLLGDGGNDQIHGNPGDDTISGGSGLDLITGDDGNDLLRGDTGDDRIFGGQGADVLWGGLGRDSLDGGLGADRLGGGAGADLFAHAGTGGQGSDWILDFDAAEGDMLVFGIAGAQTSDFSVTYQTLAGAGSTEAAEALITFLPLDRLVWILVDCATETSILLQ
jgi:serralysin